MYEVVKFNLGPRDTFYNFIPEVNGEKFWFKIRSPNGQLSFSAYLNEKDVISVCLKKNLEYKLTIS